MPRLLIFAPCDKVIIADNGTTSLITVLEEVDLYIPAEALDKMSEPADVGMTWHVLTLWTREPGEENKKFEHLVEFYLPNGQKSFSVSQPLDFTPGTINFRSIVNVQGFKVIKPGTSHLMLSLREVNDQDWVKTADFPVYVKFLSPDDIEKLPTGRLLKSTTIMSN